MKYPLSLILILASALAAGAQEFTSLEQCLQMALQNSGLVKADEIAIRRAKELQGTAWDIPNTEITLLQTPLDGGSPDNAVAFSQAFQFPTVYAAKHAKLKAETRLQEIQLDATRIQIEREVTSAYFTLLSAIDTKKSVAEFYEAVKPTLLAEISPDAQETDVLQHLSLKHVGDAARLRMAQAENEVHNAQLALQQWLNTDSKILPTEEFGHIFTLSASSAAKFHPASSPEIRALAQQEEIARKEVNIAKQAFIPEFSLTAKTQCLIKSFNPYDIERPRFTEGDFMGFEVGVAIPLFFGSKRAALKAAQRDLELAKATTDLESQRLRTEYQTAVNDYTTALKALEYYTGTSADDANKIEQLAASAYASGDIPSHEFVQHLQTALDLTLAKIQAITDYNQCAIKLLYLQKAQTTY